MSSSNVVDMPRAVTMREFTEVDGSRWVLTEYVLNDPVRYRRLVRTQIEELLALHAHYPLPELADIGQKLSELRRAYSDVEPFDHPLLAALDPDPSD